MSSKNQFSLPDSYKMRNFPCIAEFSIPGFEISHPKDQIKCLWTNDVEKDACFESFINRITESMNTRKHYPVLRISDGELEFLFGRIWFNKREGILNNIISFFRYIRDNLLNQGGLNAYSVGIYRSGKYSFKEINELRPVFLKEISNILGTGSVAFHLNYLSYPFHEQYFPKLDNLLQSLDIDINVKNTIPFYFVYALFASGRARAIFSGKHICLVHSASPEVRHIVEKNLLTALNVAKISWLTISKERSFYDVLELDNIADCDALFVGGGIGKANLFCQLSKFPGPIIDVGFYFEVWRDPDNRFKRVYCASDDEWASRGVSNVFGAGI
jgi:hypothetical protein